MHTCPVCGYQGLEGPPQDFLICPSCGVEFGYHDANRSAAELRRDWIAQGASWHSTVEQPPRGWNAVRQLSDAGFGHTITEVWASIKGTSS
jgi:hypothetical protein